MNRSGGQAQLCFCRRCAAVTASRFSQFRLRISIHAAARWTISTLASHRTLSGDRGLLGGMCLAKEEGVGGAPSPLTLRHAYASDSENNHRADRIFTQASKAGTDHPVPHQSTRTGDRPHARTADAHRAAPAFRAGGALGRADASGGKGRDHRAARECAAPGRCVALERTRDSIAVCGNHFRHPRAGRLGEGGRSAAARGDRHAAAMRSRRARAERHPAAARRRGATPGGGDAIAAAGPRAIGRGAKTDREPAPGAGYREQSKPRTDDEALAFRR